MAGTSGLHRCGGILRPQLPSVQLLFSRLRFYGLSRMRIALLPVALLLSLVPQRLGDAAFVGIGVWYAGPDARPPATATADIDAVRRDLTTIRRAGFNAITTWIAWRDAEPQRGVHALGALERIIAAAAQADLKVAVVAYTDAPPVWAANDAQAAARFLEYISKRLSLHEAVLAVSGPSPAAEAVRGRIDVRSGKAPEARLAMWSELARGARHLAFAATDTPLSPALLSLGETAGVVTRNLALFAPLRPRTGGVAAIAGAVAGGRVEVRLLESPEAILVIGLNYDPAPRKVTIMFSPEIPEAIWQNLETGTAVNFIMAKAGPFYEYTFGPRDALVLMIRKGLR